MVTQKILIDPMVPPYQVGTNSVDEENISKGGKSSRNKSEDFLKPIPIPLETSEDKSPDTDTIELKAVRDADEKVDSDPMPNIVREAEKDGIHEAMKETIKEHRQNTFKFYGLLNKSEKVVHKIKNLIPLLPSEIIIDTAKVTLVHRPFFFSERIHSISIKDITDVFVETAPFFGTLSIVDANFVENQIKINWFKKNDAEKARRIITGLMTTAKEEVDLKNIEDEALAEKLEEIGRARETKTSVTGA